MARAFGGIDPGITGALAVILPDESVRLFDTPYVDSLVRKDIRSRKTGEVESMKVNRKVFDLRSMAQLLLEQREQLRALDVRLYVTLEEVNGMPARGPGGKKIKIGATSAFFFGYGYGLWCMALVALHLRHGRVRPAEWKRLVLPPGVKGDQAEADCAARLYPAAADRLRGPRGGVLTGRVDALLLAHYGRVIALPEIAI